ncbi:MAG: hypothetical protein U0R44_02790 [Candidatus Micrarchaeia archaeon]
MGLVLYHKEAGGIGRYCPTFKAAYDRLRQRLALRSERRRERRAITGFLEKGDIEPLARAVAPSPSGMEYLGNLAARGEPKIAVLACYALRRSAESGSDISPAVPSLIRALRHQNFYMRADSAETLCAAAPGLSVCSRAMLAGSLELFVLRDLSALSPDGHMLSSIRDLVRTLGMLDGVYPISLARVKRMLRQVAAGAEGAGSCIGE